MLCQKKGIFIFLVISLISLKSSDGDGVRLPDQLPNDIQQQQQQQALQHQQAQQLQIQQQQILQQQQQVYAQQQQQNLNQQTVGPTFGEERRQGKGLLLDLVGLGTGSNVDPYVARTNANCLNGELSECFKTQALGTFDEFFARESYTLTENARVIRMPEAQLRSLYQEPFEFSSEPRSADSEWDQLLKFGLRKLEKFVKSVALEVQIPEEITTEGRYSPRFIDDIAGELDIIEDKKASHFSRHKLKKLFIPLLLILKIFKLKLLLFLPFILGLASIKKILGLAAIIIPGVIGYFKLCRPQQQFHTGSGLGGDSFFGGNNFPHYSPQGLGPASFHHEHHINSNPFYRQEPTFSKPYSDYYSKSSGVENGVRFAESAQDLSYQGYSEFGRNNNNNKDVKLS